MGDLATPSRQCKGRRSTKNQAGPKNQAHGPPAEWEQLTPKEREVAVGLRTHFGEEQFASIPGDLVVPFIRGAPPRRSDTRASASLSGLPQARATDLAGYAEETNWQGMHYVQQLLADSLEWRASVGADNAGPSGRAPRPRASPARTPWPPPHDQHGRLSPHGHTATPLEPRPWSPAL